MYEDLSPGGETIVWGQKLIILDWSASLITFRTAHAVAHLELHMEPVRLGTWFTECQERQADEHALLLLSYYPGDLTVGEAPHPSTTLRN